MVAQGLQGGRAGDGHHGRLFEAEVRRLGRELVFGSSRVLRKRALADAEHLVAGPEPGHVLTHRLHYPGQVHTEDRSLGGAEPVARQTHRVRSAGHEVPDASVHAGRMHADEHLVVGYLG